MLTLMGYETSQDKTEHARFVLLIYVFIYLFMP